MVSEAGRLSGVPLKEGMPTGQEKSTLPLLCLVETLAFAKGIDREGLEHHDVSPGRPACNEPFRVRIDHIDRPAALQVEKLADHLYALGPFPIRPALPHLFFALRQPRANVHEKHRAPPRGEAKNAPRHPPPMYGALEGPYALACPISTALGALVGNSSTFLLVTWRNG